MKHSAQIITFLSAKTGLWFNAIRAAETRPRSNFPESIVFRLVIGQFPVRNLLHGPKFKKHAHFVGLNLFNSK